MRLAFAEIAPDEHHRRARRCRQQDEACDVAVDLVFWKIRAEDPADEQPSKQRHRERLHRPVDEQRDADAAPVLLDLRQGREIDLDQHRNDHEPDQNCDGHIDLGNFRRSDGLEHAGEQVSKGDAEHDAEANPDRQIAFKRRHHDLTWQCRS